MASKAKRRPRHHRLTATSPTLQQEFESSGNKHVMALLFTIFQFFVNIVMLNLLIAIMGDQYDIVQESGHEQYLYAKAQIILEVRVGVRGQRDHLCFGCIGCRR